MKILIVEDDLTCRMALQAMLNPYGDVHIVTNGHEALGVLADAMFAESPYDLICLDIMMPELDGQEVLKFFRSAEEQKGILLGRGTIIFMTTALKDRENVLGAFNKHCDAYLVKPIDKDDLLKNLRKFGLVPSER